MLPGRLEWMTAPYYNYYYFPLCGNPPKTCWNSSHSRPHYFPIFLEVFISSERLCPSSDSVFFLTGAKSRRQLFVSHFLVIMFRKHTTLGVAECEACAGYGWGWPGSASGRWLLRERPSRSEHPLSVAIPGTCAPYFCARPGVDARWEDWQGTGTSFCDFSSLSVLHFPFGCLRTQGSGCWWKSARGTGK